MVRLIASVALLPVLVPLQDGLRDRIEGFRADAGSLRRSTVALSEHRRQRMTAFYRSELQSLGGLRFGSLAPDEQVDFVLMKYHLEHELRNIEIERARLGEIQALVPFLEEVLALELARKRLEPVEPAARAKALNELARQITSVRTKVEGTSPKPSKTIANRVVQTLTGLRQTLKNWFDFYNGYDPLFTWWCAEPYKSADGAIDGYLTFLRTKILTSNDDAIVGDPIGREALLSELQSEMIAYTPEELIRLAESEFKWCEAEMIKASRDMGFADDWKKALEKVKNEHVEPGKQPEVIRALALEAIEFLEKHDLVTIPPLAKETWRMEMLSPQQQMVSPFFLGGEVIQVSFPTNTMPHEAKEMSLRGNNIHFARATVHHELIPGHHLQGFVSDRHRQYRDVFSTPFYGEGWALYWEMLLWDMNFQKSPENRVGMLFWRMHRCARIVFSLSFHLGTMTPQECIELLVERVGHERDNATAEVRRSFTGAYSPLYQCAYLLGGLQIRELYRQYVGGGKMSPKAFHDAVLQMNSIPIDMVRASLGGLALSPDYRPTWRFHPAVP